MIAICVMAIGLLIGYILLMYVSALSGWLVGGLIIAIGIILFFRARWVARQVNDILRNR